MHVIHESLKVIRRPVAACGRIIARHLVAPGGVEGMFHDRHQFHMGIAHLLHVFRQLLGDLPVVVELAPVDSLAVFICLHGLLHPGTEMHLINRHGRFCFPDGLALLHPAGILPLVRVNVPDNGSRVGAQLREVPIGVCL